MSRPALNVALTTVAALILFAIGAPASLAAEPYYTEPPVYTSRPGVDRDVTAGHLGATGIEARIYPGVVLKVENIQPKSPAEGLIRKGDIILGINGSPLTGRNLFVAIGTAITEAESTDGKLEIDVKRGDAEQKIGLTLPAKGRYAESWPLNCPKSSKIIADASAWYSDYLSKQKGHSLENGLAALFLLSTGDDTRLPIVKGYFQQFLGGRLKDDNTWHNGYNGIACAEYYLRTGDADVLPLIQYYADDAQRRQKFESGWVHWGGGVNPGYVAGGLMNPAGAQVLTTLLLAKQCGVEVDDKTLNNSLKFFYRFAGHGSVPYGDHRSEGGLGSNGKDGMLAAAMQAATYASSDVSIYETARDNLSLSMIQSYPCIATGHGDEGRGDGVWRGLSSSYLRLKKPDLYRDAMDRLTWWYDLSRFHDGSIGIAICSRFNDPASGAGTMLAYTAPLQTLRITGAPKSKFAKDFRLPEKLWGRPADLAFLQIDPNPKYLELGPAQPVHVPYFMLGSAYFKGTQETDNAVTREQILQNIYHDQYMIRAQAGKALRRIGASDDLERLLSDPDPRVRRAALDGIIDWNYWFGMGKTPLTTEQYTPGMIAAITKMLRDPEEAWYVVDGALFAMSNMPPRVIHDNLDAITPWTESDEWWLRESSFTAMQGLAKDETLYVEVLPQLLEMVIEEYHTMPRERMTGSFRKVYKSLRADSPARETIIAGFERGIRESKVKDAPYTREGAHNVILTITESLELAPNSAVVMAEALRERVPIFDTDSLIRLLGVGDGGKKGLFDAMETLPAADKDKLATILYDTYRPELLKRLDAETDTNLGLIDTIIAVTRLKQPIAGWQPVGSPVPTERTWQYLSFDATAEADIMPRREHKRFRDVTLPAGLDGWFMPDYEPKGWQSGLSPIGKGVFGNAKTMTPNRSDWGTGEFLVARTTFEVDAIDYDLYRVRFLSNQGFRVYLNGKPVANYIWWSDNNGPQYRNLSPEDAKLLRKGTNTLAVYTNCEYPFDMNPKRKTETEVGQMEFFIEGLKLKDIRN